MRGGQGRDAKVDGLAAHVHLDTAVLRDAFLRDGDVGHDLQTGDHGELEALRGIVRLDEHAVDAVADAETFFQGLQMNVGGAAPDGLEDDLVNQLDDGRVALVVLRPARAGAARVGDDLGLVAGGDVVEQFLHGLLVLAVETVDMGEDLVGRRDHGLDRCLQIMAEAVDRIDVERIADRHTDGVRLARHRENRVFHRERARQQGHQLAGGAHVGHLDHGHAKLVGEELGGLLGREPVLGDQHVKQSGRRGGEVGVPGDNGAGGLYLVGLQHALVEG